MVKTKSRGMMKKDIEDMTIAEYIAYEPLKEDTNFVSEDESETSEQRMITDTNDDKPSAPNPQHENEELIPEEDLDGWLKAELEIHMCGQDKESEEDALIKILKSLVGECKSVYTNKSTQIETSSRRTNEVHGMYFVAEDEEGD
nr:hypothetical protein [Tanacetum cinerariifolium]